jgi:hypothetical protein
LALTRVENSLHDGGCGRHARCRGANDNDVGTCDDGGAGSGGTTPQHSTVSVSSVGNKLSSVLKLAPTEVAEHHRRN